MTFKIGDVLLVDLQENEVELDGVKNEMIKQVRERTDELVEQGITFDGKIFPMELQDKTNFMFLLLAEITNYVLSTQQTIFPKNVRTKNEENYQFNDIAHYMSYVQTSFGRIEYIYSEGWNLRDLILSKTTLSELQSLVDTRT